MRRLTMEEIVAKFIDEGRREHEDMEICIKEFRTTNELLFKTRSNLLSELKIKVNELSKVVSNVLIQKNEVKGVTTKGGKMTSKATRSKEINETGINKNEPPRFEQDVQEKPHDDGVENKSLTLLQIPKYAEYLKSLLTNKSRLEEACTETMNKRCSTVLLNELPSKEKDPKNFTIPFQVLEKHKEAEDLAADHLSRFESSHMEVVPPNWTFEKRKRFFSQVKTYFWEEPYAFKLCADNIMRICVAGSETLEILVHCHSGPTGGHHSVNVTRKKVYESGFYWPSVFKDANEYVEAQALPTNDARVVVKFLRSLFARFGVPKALISNRGTQFCDKVLLYNFRLKMYPRKLKSKRSGPNIVKMMYPHGAIEITDRNGFSFKVNGQRLKKYYGGDIDKEDDEVIKL
ncbi:reverse transcriptase domain-containing protein [Tanacetum coccineum]